MTVVIAALVGFLAGRMLWLSLRRTWSRQPFLRANYQGEAIPTAAGVVVGSALVLVEALRAVVGASGAADHAGLTPARTAGLLAVLGFSVIGAVADLTGPGSDGGRKGVGGHLRAIASGHLSGSSFRFLAGAAVSVVAASLLAPLHLGTLVMDAAIIGLTANLVRIVDVRPGRGTKTASLVFLVLAIGAGFDAGLVSAAVAVGAAFALLLDDLHERLMLGRTGAYAMGAAVGTGLATQLGATGRAAAVVVLAATTLLAEVVPFSRLFETIPPLRSLDRMGRRAPATVDIREEGASVLRPDLPFRRATAPAKRGTVGGAHESSHAGSLRREQSLFGSGGPEAEATAPAPARPAADVRSDLFGYDRGPVGDDDVTDDAGRDPDRF